MVRGYLIGEVLRVQNGTLAAVPSSAAPRCLLMNIVGSSRSRRMKAVDPIMDTLTISVKHVASLDSRLCGVCAAAFIPAEDSGSRVLSMTGAHQEGFAGLLCGGCYSKWSHGTTVALRRG